MRLSRAAQIRRTAHSSGGDGGVGSGAQGERSSASLPSMAWRFYVFHRIAPTLSKNVILAEVFLIHFLSYKSRYVARLNTF